MKVIAINTSPRKNSNVRSALEAALEGAAEKGAETEIIDVSALSVSPCQADDFCKAHDSQCALNDGMAQIYEKIEEADGIILGSPIYFFDVSAQAKTVIDRMYCYFMNEKFTELFSNKTVSIITTNGGAPVEAFESSLNTQMQAFGALGFKTGQILPLGGNLAPGEILDKKEQLALAKELGKNII